MSKRNNFLIAIVWLAAVSCSTKGPTITGVSVSFPGENTSSAQLAVQTAGAQDVYIKYRPAEAETDSFVTLLSPEKSSHQFLLTGLKPGCHYLFNVVANKAGRQEVSPAYSFRTIDASPGIRDSFRVVCADTSVLPGVFRKGYVMVHRREVPGIVVLLNAAGNVVWHHEAKDEGFKVVNFTPRGTLLCLMGSRDYETSYGCALLELSLQGDTLLYLKKGQNDFQQTVHHEVLLNGADQVVTLCVEDRVMDLRSRGGGARDTVRGDGILVLDRQGRRVWKWTVFDEADPLKEEKIVAAKKDWMHANSLSFDRDGNYLVSFYNNGQIWKIDARSGKVLWKLGRGGDFALPGRAQFDQAHAVHITDQGWMMLFDNGTANHLSRSVALSLDEKAKRAELVIDTWLPPELFTDRMGSSYMVGDSTLLLCASRQKTVALTNLRGTLLWQLVSSRVVSYRAEFIPCEKLAPYIALR